MCCVNSDFGMCVLRGIRTNYVTISLAVKSMHVCIISSDSGKNSI